MAGIQYVQTEVLRRNIGSQFMRGGQAERWLDRVRRNMHRRAVNEAPSRSGELKAGHRSDIRGSNGALIARATISNVVEHAEWVHGGTDGPIEGNPWLYLPAWGPYPKIRKQSVRGQQANPWLERACTLVAGQYGAIRIG